MKLILHTVSEGSTVRIFTIPSIGTVGTTTRFTTIRSIIPHGILHTIIGVGDIAGTHHGIAGDGDTPRITAIGIVHIILTMAGVILTIPGTDMGADGMPIRIITVTASEDPPEPMYFGVAPVKEEHQLQECVHLPAQPKVPAMLQLQEIQTTVAGQLQVRG